MLKRLVLSLAGLVLVGCANVTPTGGPYKALQTSGDLGELVVYRTGGYPLMAGDIAQVLSNGKPFGHLFHGMFIQEAMPPGEYVIQVQQSSNSRYFWRFQPVAIKVNATSAETVFVELDMTTFKSGAAIPLGGLIVGGSTSGIQVKQVSKEAGLKAIEGMQRVLITDK
jgi:hypothetical protein